VAALQLASSVVDVAPEAAVAFGALAIVIWLLLPGVPLIR
jgi:hypothetical protein